MAKKRAARKDKENGGTNKSQMIREFLAEHPQASTKEIRAELQSRGVDVSHALISRIKYGPAPVGGRRRAEGWRGNGAEAPAEETRGPGGYASKSDAIRAKLSEMGAETRPRDIIAALASDGIQVEPAQVSAIRTKLLGKRAGRRGRRGRRRRVAAATAAAPAAPRAAAGGGEKVTIREVFAAKELADQLGGVEQVRRALDALERLR